MPCIHMAKGGGEKIIVATTEVLPVARTFEYCIDDEIFKHGVDTSKNGIQLGEGNRPITVSTSQKFSDSKKSS